jgi:hypothetical protein
MGNPKPHSPTTIIINHHQPSKPQPPQSPSFSKNLIASAINQSHPLHKKTTILATLEANIFIDLQWNTRIPKPMQYPHQKMPCHGNTQKSCCTNVIPIRVLLNKLAWTDIPAVALPATNCTPKQKLR